MPYRGAPSKGCKACRERKIRCDQRTPGCLNCEKARETCPGYRDQLDLMFLDQTQGVTNKARKAAAATRTSSTTPVNHCGPPELKKSLSAGDSPRSLTSDLEVQASAFFFEHFALDESLSLQCQLRITSIADATPGTQALIHSIRALGLAGLSQESGSAHLLRLAESQYLDAIRAMNSALQDPKIAKEDDTLLSVMILTSFETMANTSMNTLAAWSNHVKGAEALLAARGPEQFQSSEGLQMFIQASIPVLISNMCQGVVVSPALKSLTEEAKKHVDPSDLAWQMFEHKMLFADFFGQVKQKIITDPLVIVQRAWELDEMGARVTSSVDETWSFQIVHLDETNDLVPLGYYHVYSYYICAEMWTGVRALRILLNQMIRSVLLLCFAARPPLFTESTFTLMFQRATDNLRMLQAEVIASVPQYLGYTSHRASTTASTSPVSSSLKSRSKSPLSRTPTPSAASTSSSTPTNTPQFLWSHFPHKPYALPFTSTSNYTSNPNKPQRINPLPIIGAAGGANLPWLLFLLGTTDIATPKTRQWSVDRLWTIGGEMGVQQALVLADKLESGTYVEMEAWYRKIWEGVIVISGAREGEADGEGEQIKWWS